MEIYDFSFKNNAGEEVNLSSYKDKVLLIVNTATFCGLTPQYKSLQGLYNKFKDSGLEIIAFPCNQFNEQEPNSDQDIKEFCDREYGVTFTLAAKIEVNGENAHPLYKFLTDFKEGSIDWNFEKFVVLKDGQIKNFGPATTPEEIEPYLESML